MAVKIRLARSGAKKRPYYRIVAANGDAPRDGSFLEKLGAYNPLLPKDHAQRITVNQERLSYWLKTGAQPTDRVARMLGDMGLVAKPVSRETPKKSQPKKKMQDRAAARAEKLKAAQEPVDGAST
jgi:small subunit ribosomal protein S16